MPPSRLSRALELGAVTLPSMGTLAVFCSAMIDLAPDLDRDRLHVITPWRPSIDALGAQGVSAGPETPESAAAAIVHLPRSREAGRLLIAQACACVAPGGLVLVDGQKSDGIDAFFRDIRARTPIQDSFVKFHGRLFWFAADPAVFADWADILTDWPKAGAFHTAPGVFSADGPDPASEALAHSLPATLSGRIADLGAGWGYLAAQILTRPGVTSLDLVEADHTALGCARKNVQDSRADFHWADATSWSAAHKLDAVIMNPPFHIGHAAEPALGRAFIENAARLLNPNGVLWLVANRQLPYEATVETHFSSVDLRDAPPGFKIFRASGLRKSGRAQSHSQKAQGAHQ